MANELPSRRNRIRTQFIPPEVFFGRRQMTKIEILESKLRHCHTCGRVMKYHEFFPSACNDLSKFGYEMIDEIWENDIFVINCCACHRGCSDAVDSLAHAVWNYEYMQNPTV